MNLKQYIMKKILSPLLLPIHAFAPLGEIARKVPSSCILIVLGSFSFVPYFVAFNFVLKFRLFVYKLAVCLQYSCLFTIQLFVYNSAICLHFSTWFTFQLLFTIQLFVYNAAVCLQFSFLYTIQLFVNNSALYLQFFKLIENSHRQQKSGKLTLPSYVLKCPTIEMCSRVYILTSRKRGWKGKKL